MDSANNFHLRTLVFFNRSYRILRLYAKNRSLKAWTHHEREKVRKYHDLKHVHLELPTSRTNCCSLDKLVLYVTAQGDVTPCPFVPFSLGNMKDHTLAELWNSYVDQLDLESRRLCPKNNPQTREDLKNYIHTAATSMQEEREI